MRPQILPVLSSCIALLVVIVSCTAIFTPGFYAAETKNWQVQSIGQDIINMLVVAPFLLVTSIRAARGNDISRRMWGGALFYLSYTFAIYCFDVHFNSLFLVYCLLLGLSVYGSLLFLLLQNKHVFATANISIAGKVAGIYFIVTAVLFYGLWLADIIPAILQHTAPSSLEDAGLFTNPVHVLDLSVYLPGIFLTGTGILRKKRLAIELAPAVLAFFILMDTTIAVLTVMMKYQGVATDISAAVIMGILAVWSIVLLVWYSRTKPREKQLS